MAARADDVERRVQRLERMLLHPMVRRMYGNGFTQAQIAEHTDLSLHKVKMILKERG